MQSIATSSPASKSASRDASPTVWQLTEFELMNIFELLNIFRSFGQLDAIARRDGVTSVRVLLSIQDR